MDRLRAIANQGNGSAPCWRTSEDDRTFCYETTKTTLPFAAHF